MSPFEALYVASGNLCGAVANARHENSLQLTFQGRTYDVPVSAALALHDLLAALAPAANSEED